MIFHLNKVVRTQSKLEKLLSEKGISDNQRDSHLRIVSGSATDVNAVRQTLLNQDGTLASLIVSGVGGAPKLWPNPLKPTLDQPTICQDSMRTVIEAIKNIRATGREYAPYAVAISTTGVDDSVDDVPWLLHPLYHW